MTGPVFYELIKFWLPLITAGGIGLRLIFAIRKLYISTKDSIVSWANVLLENHMTHIQAAAENASISLAMMTETNKELASTIKLLRDDFVGTQHENLRIQSAILTGIEVLKDRG